MLLRALGEVCQRPHRSLEKDTASMASLRVCPKSHIYLSPYPFMGFSDSTPPSQEVPEEGLYYHCLLQPQGLVQFKMSRIQ